MTGGIRAEVKVKTTEACPIADATADRRNAISDVSRNLSSGDGTVVEEFTTDADASVEDDRMYPVFTYDSRATYRFEREGNLDCPCHQVEQHDIPVAETTIEDGSIVMAFHVTDLDELETVIDDLRDDYTISIERLVQAGGRGDGESDDLVFVDRGALTDRQLQVLTTAHEMGYFEYSKESNAGEVAAELGISTSTFSEHLAAAQRKLFGALVEE
ncbi:MAG: putative DNA binding protein [Halobacteriales archaeon]|jgi:predicted DNA binding protein